MRMLVLSAPLLYPTDTGGRIRTARMFEHIAREHDVTFICFRRPGDTDTQVEAMRACCREIITIPWDEASKGSLRFYAEVGASLARALPFTVAKYRSAAMREALERLLASGRFDVFVCDFLQPAVNCLDLAFRPKVLFEHNVEAMIFERHVDQARNPLARWLLRHEASKLAAFEQRAARAFDHTVMVSEADAAVMRSAYGVTSVSSVPTGVDADHFAPRGVPEPDTLVFTGSMDWHANQDAVRFFVDEILPLIRARRPVQTWLVGRNPPEWLRRLASTHPGIHVTGTVDDVRPYVAKAAVYVVPLRVGGGTRIKIFEAMAMGRPVVSTTVGAEGLPVVDGLQIELADAPVDFAARVVSLLEDPVRAGDMGRTARRLVVESHSWVSSARAFVATCTAVACHGLGGSTRRGTTARSEGIACD